MWCSVDEDIRSANLWIISSTCVIRRLESEMLSVSRLKVQCFLCIATCVAGNYVSPLLRWEVIQVCIRVHSVDVSVEI